MNNETRVSMLRNAPIPQVLLKMGLPTMIGMLVTGIYNLVDAYFGVGLEQAKWGLFLFRFHWGKP